MSIILLIICFIGAILIVAQSLFEVTLNVLLETYLLIPLSILFIIGIVLSIRDIRKYGLKLSKKVTKKDHLYEIINNLSAYHKIIDSNNKIDLILISQFGVVTINILKVNGTIKVLDNGDLYYIKKGGKEGKINNFIKEINDEVDTIKKIVNISNIDKYLIKDKELMFEGNFAEGFNLKHTSHVFYELEKRKEVVFTKEEVDRMYELIKNGNNKN